jgi:hypothetical protein
MHPIEARPFPVMRSTLPFGGFKFSYVRVARTQQSRQLPTSQYLRPQPPVKSPTPRSDLHTEKPRSLPASTKPAPHRHDMWGRGGTQSSQSPKTEQKERPRHVHVLKFVHNADTTPLNSQITDLEELFQARIYIQRSIYPPSLYTPSPITPPFLGCASRGL